MINKFHIITFGCQMNEHDSEIMAGLLSEEGMAETENRDEADVVIINTCSVRENADNRFFGTLGQLKRRKESDEEFMVCVCGCMMQQQHIIDRVKEKYPWVDVIFGTHNIHALPRLLKNARSEKTKQREIPEEVGEIEEGLPAVRKHKAKALVNIMYGCNNFCTYCIVPYTRGRERSRRPEAIVEEVRALTEDGVKEVMLLGQNVNSYKGGDTDFAGLIYMLNDIDGLQRIRFMTSHPKDLSDRLINAYVECEKLCKNIHLPVQAGSSAVLKRMNRHYDREKYLGLVKRLKEAVPGITISTDIIVGFPGETEEDFQETLSLVKEVEYDSAFTFLYSIRKGTPAAEYDDQIPEDVKHDRFNRLVELINEISSEKNMAYEGRLEEVLVEGAAKSGENIYSGRTDGFKLVNFYSEEDLTGDMARVRITRGKTFSLEGRLVRGEENGEEYR